MDTNNRFDDYLINDYRAGLFSMWDEVNLWDFMDLYFGRLILFSDDGQGELPRIWSTLYYFDEEKYMEMPCSLIEGYEQYHNGIFTPGDLVWNDISSDAFIYGKRNGWCLPRTFDIMDDIDIILKTRNMSLSFRLRMVDDGFIKFYQKWEWDDSFIDERLYCHSDEAD